MNPNTTSTDWNVWSNWIEGSPYKCTDVVIPTGAKVYPVLTTPVADNDNQCNGIHFEPELPWRMCSNSITRVLGWT